MHWIPPGGLAEPNPNITLVNCDQSGVGVRLPDADRVIFYDTETEGRKITVKCVAVVDDDGMPALHCGTRLPMYGPRPGSDGYIASQGDL